MANVSLATYTISFSKAFTERKLPMGDVQGQDVFDLLIAYLKEHKLAKKKEEAKHLISATILKSGHRQISGTLQTGDYGYTSEILDGIKLKTAYQRKVTDAEMLPFFFLFDLPEKENKGILILQRFKTFGIRKLLADDFAKFARERTPGVSVAIEPVVHPGILEEFQSEGKATKIRLRQHEIPKDICDRVRGLQPKDGYVEYTIFAKKNKTLNPFKGWLKDSKRTLLSLPGFNPDTVLYELKLNGRSRTIDASNPGHLRAYFNVTDKVEFGKNGHPTFESLHREASELLVDLWAELKGAANV